MVLRVALFAMIALGVAGLGAVAWIGLRAPAAPVQTVSVAPAEAPPPPAAKASILVAGHALRAGSLLKVDDVAAQEVPANAVPAGARIDTPAARGELVGAMVRRSLLSEAPLLPEDVLRPGDHGFLAAVLQPGMRATTVGVDAVTGSAGLIWPGDRVDLILTQVQDDTALPAGRRASAETVLTDVRVIAIDQQLMQGTVGGSTEQPVARTVTLEVSPAQAERVAVAIRLGRLSLSVRAAESASADTAEDVTRTALAAPVTWGGDVSPALNQGRGGGHTVRLYLGKDEGKELKF